MLKFTKTVVTRLKIITEGLNFIISLNCMFDLKVLLNVIKCACDWNYSLNPIKLKF